MITQRIENPRSAGRHYGLDWLRIGAFALLILYHIGMVFAPGDWLVKAPRTIGAAAWPMIAVQPWRMPLLFAVSGYASHALLTRTGDAAKFLQARSARLLVPFAFAMLFLVAPQTWIGLVQNHGYQAGLVHFWTTEWWRFHALDGVFLPDTEHLWFIAYLWTYTMLLGAAIIVTPVSWKDAIGRLTQWLGTGQRLLWLPLLPLLVIRIALLFTVPETHGLLHDWVSDLLYIPAFLFGFALFKTPALWSAIARCWAPALAIAVASCAILLAIEVRLPDGVVHRPHAVQAFQRDAGMVMTWSMILLLLGAADRWLNRDHPLRGTLSEAVFPFYLVHQTIIVVVGWWIRDSALGPAAMFAVLIVATGAGCWLFYDVGRRIPPLRPLIGLSPAAARRTASEPPVVQAA